MIPRKLLEAAFRRWWLLVVPVILTPLLVLALTRATPQYQSVATVWVSQPSNIASTAIGRSTNPFQTVADAQAQAMRDLLNTKAFRESVATAAGLPGPVGADVVERSVGIGTAGANLLEISAAGSDARAVQSIVNAVISEYQARATTESERQTSISIQYYNNQVAVARTDLDTRITAVNSYLRDHPLASDPKSGDLTYQRLVGAADSQTKVVDGLLALLQEAQRTAASAPQSLEAIFSVQDHASLPTAPQPVSLSKRVGYPAAGLLFGILIAATYLYVVYRTDHTIRGMEDVYALNVPLLGYVPDLQAASRGRTILLGPVGWLAQRRHRDYARQVAASIAPIAVQEGTQ